MILESRILKGEVFFHDNENTCSRYILHRLDFTDFECLKDFADYIIEYKDFNPSISLVEDYRLNNNPDHLGYRKETDFNITGLLKYLKEFFIPTDYNKIRQLFKIFLKFNDKECTEYIHDQTHNILQKYINTAEERKIQDLFVQWIIEDNEQAEKELFEIMQGDK